MFGCEVFQESGRAYVTRTLQTVLERVGATEMVIGHTPQACHSICCSTFADAHFVLRRACLCTVQQAVLLGFSLL